MALQTCVGIRIAVKGDGKSRRLDLNFDQTIVQFVDGHYGYVDMYPDSVVQASIGGPDISPETRDSWQIETTLVREYLQLLFPFPLGNYKELYTVELVLGYEGVRWPRSEEAPPAAEEPAAAAA